MQVFSETYRRKSFSDAAKSLFTSRQSVARSIENIEEVLGLPLFTRASSGVSATSAGDEFYTRCQPIIQSVYDMMSHMEKYKRKSNLEIRLGCLGNINSTRKAMNISAKFMKSHPDITIKCIDLTGKDIADAHQKGEVDFSFINLDIFTENKELRKIPLEEEEFYLVVHKNHPLAYLEKVTASALQDSPLIFLSRHHIAIRVFENWMRAAGVDRCIIENSGDIEHLQNSILEDQKAAVLLQSMSQVMVQTSSDLVQLHLSAPLVRHAGLLFREDMDLTGEQQEFINFFCAEYENASPKKADLKAWAFDKTQSH